MGWAAPTTTSHSTSSTRRMEMLNDTGRKVPTAKELRLFGLLWLIFFGVVGAIAYFKPEALIGGAIFMAVGWLCGFLFSGASRLRMLPGIALPLLFALAAEGARFGLTPQVVLIGLIAIGLLGACAVWALPSFGRKLHDGWIDAASPIGWTVTHVVLAIVYYLVLTPIGLLMRIAGRDPMRRKIDPRAATYWIERKNPIDSRRYFRQF